MNSARASAADVLATLRSVARVSLALLLKVALLTVVGLIALVVAIAVYAGLVGPAVYAQVADLAVSIESLSLVALATATPLLIIALVVSVIWVGAVILAANARAAGRKASLALALPLATRRVLPAIAVFAIWSLGVVVALALTPVFVLVGLVGLALTPLARRSSNRWPRIRTLVALAIPFGVAFLLLVRWSLALPAVWIDRRGIRSALRESWERVEGRTIRVTVVLAVVLAVTLGLTLGAQALTAQLGANADLVGSLVTLILAGPLPFVASTVLYRPGKDGRDAAKAVTPREHATRRRVAALLVGTLILPVAIVGGVSSPASATGSTAVSFSIEAESSPITAGVPVIIHFRVTNAVTAEGVQPTGTLDISVDGVPLPGPFVPQSFGSSSYQLTQTFIAGSHLIAAHYSGDGMYVAADADVTLIVGAGQTSSTALTVTPSTLVFGNDATLKATVTSASTPTGSVEFFWADGVGAPASLGTTPVDGLGVATLVSTTIPPGSHDVTAVYSGDSTITSSQSTVVPVTASNATTTMTLSVSPASPSAAGAPLTATVTVAATDSPATPVGTVSLYLIGAGTLLAQGPLAGGTVDLAFSLDPGLRGLDAVFTPGTGFAATDTVGAHIVSAFAATVALGASASSTVFGEPVEFTATVTAGPNPGGTVTFEAQPGTGGPIALGSSPVDSSGVASFSAAALAVGSYDIVASYSGSATAEAGTSSAVAHTVAKSNVDVTVSPSTTTPAFGDDVIVTVTVAAASPGAGTPSGTVTLSRDGTVVESKSLNFAGVATFTVAGGGCGDRLLSAAYAGDAGFGTGAGQVHLTVAKQATSVNVFGAQFRSETYGASQTFAGSVISDDPTPSGTLQLWVAGTHVADGTLNGTGGFSITTDRIPVGATLSNEVWISYLGDGSFEPSDSHNPTHVVYLEMVKASSTPIVTIDPTAVGIGSSVVISATLATPGAGPTGTVTFSTLAGGVIGSSNVVGGVATLPWTVNATQTRITAVYSGDGNFATTTSAALVVDADRAAANVVVTDPGTLEYGTVFYLTATTTIGDGSTAAADVDFSTVSGMVIADDVPTVAGVAKVQVCAGDAAGCPAGIPQIGLADQGILAAYPESGTNLAGLSSPVAYHVVDAQTTTSLGVTPTAIVQGSAVFLTATVSSVTSSATPSGHVSFYAVTPVSGGGAESFLVNATLVGGVATAETQSGNGLTDIRWPADAIIARYVPDGAPFDASNDSVAVTVGRLATTVDVFVGAVTAFQPTLVQVTLGHAGGSTADFTGKVTVTADNGATCEVFVAAPAHGASCSIAWNSVGAHSFTATYSGDVVYEAGSSVSTPVTVGKATPVLGASVTSPVTVGQTATATWIVFDPTATGTVTVWGDGIQWCVAALAAGSCTGTFGPSSAASSPVSVIVRYSGDSTWNQVQDDLLAIVTGCFVPDVYATNPSLGTVSIDTPPNCGVSGYTGGTSITVTAHPIAPNELLTWQKFVPGSPGLVLAATTTTTSFTITSDTNTWVHVATFGLPCYPITAQVTGNGSLLTIPDTNCTSTGGTRGFLLGTRVSIFPNPSVNPTYGDKDVFYFFGNVAGAVVDRVGTADPKVSLTIAGPTTVPIMFGPRCRVVTVLSDPSATGDVGSVLTPPTCFSPLVQGFLPGDSVTVSMVYADTSHVLSGWTIDSVAAPALGRQATPTINVDYDDITVRATTAVCFALDVKVDGALDNKSDPIGYVTADPKPNCPDHGPRYLANTVVTLTPVVGAAGTRFTGWDDDSTTAAVAAAAGPISSASKSFLLDRDLTVAAGFYTEDSCSRLSLFGTGRNLVSLDSTGCGPGFYYDTQKQWAARLKQDASTLWGSKYLSTISVTTPSDLPLNIYAGIRGETHGCFGTQGTPGPASGTGATQYYGPLTRPSADCRVAGDITLTVEACQSLMAAPEFTIDGDASGRRYSSDELPGTINMKDPTTGEFGSYSLSGFNWVEAVSVIVGADSLTYDALDPGPCREVGNAFPVGKDIAIYALGPGDSFIFNGWSGYGDGLVEANPVLRTSDLQRVMTVVPSYTLSCHTVTFGEGISIMGDAPRCPGSAEGDNSFITGTAIQVKADFKVGSRELTGFVAGYVKDQVTEDSSTKEQSAWVLVDGDKSVRAEYLTKTQLVGHIIGQGGKIMAGVLAIVAPMALGILFPPAGVLFAVLAAAAGIASLIPGGDSVAAVFDLVNPTKITTCAAQWAFTNHANPTGKANVGAIIKTVNNIRKLTSSTEVVTKPVADLRSVPGSTGALTKGLANLAKGMKVALGAAALGYSLYSAGVGNADVSTAQSTDELRDTATMTTCLNEQWRAAT
ncbi:MAG: hypothetical protein JWP19_1979 [Rhodoglobus sp.]|nr:hypothetical protein [Rhodoglobus sp.]